jgi:signal transduction histidine kinase/CheY-like chemotaxis protein
VPGDFNVIDSLVASTAFSAVLAGSLGFAWKSWRQPYLAYWASYWALYAVVWPGLAMVHLLDQSLLTGSGQALGFGVMVAAFAARSLAALGMLAFMGWHLPTRRQLVAVAGVILLLSAGGGVTHLGLIQGWLPKLATLPFRTCFTGGLLFAVLGVAVLRERGPAGRPQRLIGVALLASAASDALDLGLDFASWPAWFSSGMAQRLSAVGTQVCDTLFASGMLVAAIGTERARAEEVAGELRARKSHFDQAQRLDAIGQLAGGVAHDFNNLLTAIGGSLSFLRERIPAGDSALEDVAVAAGATHRAAELTRQLLTFARKEVVQPRLVDLNERVTSLDPLLRSLTGEDRVQHLRLAARLWPVRIDPIQLERLVVNLVANARDATETGGNITIETANVALGDESRRRDEIGAPAGHWVRLAVEDDGRGMDNATRARVFEPFFTTKPVGQGTGLGLATVHGIVTQAGGYLGLRTAPGRGARFTILLPRAEGAPEVLVPARRSSWRSGTETVLLVEDDPLVRTIATRALAGRGYRVVPAGDGREALRAVEAGLAEVGLLVTDVVMPFLGGPQLASELLRRRPDLPVLFISGYAPNQLEEGLPRGASVDFLPKPFRPEELAERARALIDRAGAVAPPSAGPTTLN